jgi:hypothetical protein
MTPSKRCQESGIDEVKADHGAAGDGENKARQCYRFLWPKMIRENSSCRILIRVLNLVP